MSRGADGPTGGPLISPSTLQARLGRGERLRIIDVRWRLGQPHHGPKAHVEGRIPGSVWLDLDADLSEIGDPVAGRHPLPSPEDAVARLARAGIDDQTPVVVYDDLWGGVAARLWWMLGWLGGPEAMVLDGGFDRWVAEGCPIERGPMTPAEPAAPWMPRVRDGRIASADEMLDGRWLRIDARDAPRYRGETEPVDPIAGHIPGAINAPWKGNLAAGRMADPETLRRRFTRLGVTDPTRVICYCGSGVTACHDLLAMHSAGLFGARLYPGSWSAWCQRPGSPIARCDDTGAETIIHDGQASGGSTAP